MELDWLDLDILDNIAKEPGKPIRNAFLGLNYKESRLYYRVRKLYDEGLIELDSKTAKGRKLATITAKGREALRA